MTGPYARRITPRRHIAPAGIEPATSGFKVRRPSPEDSLRSSSEPCLASFDKTPAETPGLYVAAAIAAEQLTSDFRALSADGVRSLLYRNERKPSSREPGTPHSHQAVY